MQPLMYEGHSASIALASVNLIWSHGLANSKWAKVDIMLKNERWNVV